MKEAIIFPGPKVTIQNVDFPELPGPNYVIIKVVVSGCNPKDWGIAERVPGINQGDDIAGTIHSAGALAARSFPVGTRVAAFHEMMTPHGSFAEYAVAPAATTIRLPDHISFEEGATIPLAALTAAVGLYQRLGMPMPWASGAALARKGHGEGSFKPTGGGPLVVYGAASAVGAFAVKMAVLGGVHPIIAVAGRGISFVETLIDRSLGDTIVDYRHKDGAAGIVREMQAALGGGDVNVKYAFDAVTDHGSLKNIMEVIDMEEGRVTVVLARKKYEAVPVKWKGDRLSFTQVGKVHSDRYPGMPGVKEGKAAGEKKVGDTQFGEVMCKFMEVGLREEWFRGHPFEVRSGGLGGIEAALTDLKKGKASATKYVFRIGETEGAGKEKL